MTSREVRRGVERDGITVKHERKQDRGEPTTRAQSEPHASDWKNSRGGEEGAQTYPAT